MFFPTGSGDKFKRYEHRVHPYSGLDPIVWKRFLDSIREFKKLLGTKELDSTANALYATLDHIRNLGLGSDYQDELDGIANELGYDGEFVINMHAISQGLHFFPKYLNETIPKKTENVRVTRRRGDT